MSEARHDLLPAPGAPRTLDERPDLRAADADRDATAARLGAALFAKRAIYGRDSAGDDRAPVIRLVGDARFSKVAVFRGRHDPAIAWQHHLPRQLVQPR